MTTDSFIVYRPRLGENIVTNMMEAGDVVLNEQQISEWYEEGHRKSRIWKIKEDIQSLNRQGVGFMLDGNQTELDRIKAERIVLQNELEQTIATLSPQALESIGITMATNG